MPCATALDEATDPAVAFLPEEVVDVKRTYGALLLSLLHRGGSRAVAPDVAMHGLSSEGAEAKAKAMRMGVTWPAAPSPNAQSRGPSRKGYFTFMEVHRLVLCVEGGAFSARGQPDVCRPQPLSPPFSSPL